MSMYENVGLTSLDYIEEILHLRKALADVSDECSKAYDKIANFEQQRWVSVKDRLPEKGTYDRYLVHVENTTNFNRLLDNVIIALWCDDDWLYDGWEDNRVTHWMPLPESPTKGE